MKPALLVTALLVAFLAGCSGDPHFDHLYYTNVSSAPGKASLRPRAVELERGIAVKALVFVIGDDGEIMDQPGFQTSDPTVFGVDPGPNAGEFVFYGVEAGSAELDVFSKYGYEAALPVTVLPP